MKFQNCENPENIYMDKHVIEDEITDILLRILFSKGGKPHQIIVFCFNKLVYPSRYNTTNGKAKIIVAELSDKTLKELAELFKEEFFKISDINIKKINFLMKPFYDSIEKWEYTNKKLKDFYTQDLNGNYKLRMPVSLIGPTK